MAKERHDALLKDYEPDWLDDETNKRIYSIIAKAESELVTT